MYKFRTFHEVLPWLMEILKCLVERIYGDLSYGEIKMMNK